MPTTSCAECGVEIDPSQTEVNAAVDQILETSLKDAEKKAGVCPLCGHSKEIPYSHRKSVQFGILVSVLTITAIIAGTLYESRQTVRADAVNEAVRRLNLSSDLLQLIGEPITVSGKVEGAVTEDETGWREANLRIPVRGSSGTGTAHVVGGRGTGPWTFSTLEVEIQGEHKIVNLVTGKIVSAEPGAYVDVHTQVAAQAEFTLSTSPPRIPEEFPCVLAAEEAGLPGPVTNCAMPIPLMQSQPVHQMEVDLRYGQFILRETDLFLDDTFKVPLTRTYNSGDWIHPNRVHALGKNWNHPYDIAPLGSRNPYTFLMIALEDSEFLYFDRISKGTGYADAVYQHTETSGTFYQAILKWNGNGWTVTLSDGGQIIFPESYNATNMAQGAPTAMLDADGQELTFVRDPARNLLELRTPHDDFIKFKNDTSGRIVEAVDHEGNSARYAYSADGMLTDVVLSTGSERHFTYVGSLMTWIKDEGGRTIVHNSYQQGRLERQDFADGTTYLYSYKLSSNGRSIEAATVAFPDGTRKEIAVAQFVPEYVKRALAH
jgi:YD repeat-containing protein